MAFTLRNLSVLAYANRFTLWHYRDDAPREVMLEPRYFDSATTLLQAGDVILAVSREGVSLMAVAQTERAVVLTPLMPG
jgi:hypothetical protein